MDGAARHGRNCGRRFGVRYQLVPERLFRPARSMSLPSVFRSLFSSQIIRSISSITMTLVLLLNNTQSLFWYLLALRVAWLWIASLLHPIGNIIQCIQRLPIKNTAHKLRLEWSMEASMAYLVMVRILLGMMLQFLDDVIWTRVNLAKLLQLTRIMVDNNQTTPSDGLAWVDGKDNETHLPECSFYVSSSRDWSVLDLSDGTESHDCNMNLDLDLPLL